MAAKLLLCLSLTKVLEAAGTTLDKTLKTTCYLNNIDDYGAFNEACKYLGTPFTRNQHLRISNPLVMASAPLPYSPNAPHPALPRT